MKSIKHVSIINYLAQLPRIYSYFSFNLFSITDYVFDEIFAMFFYKYLSIVTMYRVTCNQKHKR